MRPPLPPLTTRCPAGCRHFQGAGKTTLINHIHSAQHGKRIAIIENEFGEVRGWLLLPPAWALPGRWWRTAPLHQLCVWVGGRMAPPSLTDASPLPLPPCPPALLAQAQVGVDDGLVIETKEKVFEMNNGCVCCTGEHRLAGLAGRWASGPLASRWRRTSARRACARPAARRRVFQAPLPPPLACPLPMCKQLCSVRRPHPHPAQPALPVLLP